MKRFNLIYLLVVGSFLLTSCGSNFLDGEDSENTTGSIVEGRPDAARTLLRGIYAHLFNPSIATSHDEFGLKALDVISDLMCDDFILADANSFFRYDYDNDYREDNFRRTKHTWQELYATIFYTNNVLKAAEILDKNGEEYKDVAGQAYVLRAYMHFLLINWYQQPYSIDKTASGVPIKRLDAEQDLPGRNTVEDVYKGILEDIDKGYNLLVGIKHESKVDIDEFSAAAIYARILCFVNDHPNQWQEVAKYADYATQGGILTEGDELKQGFNTLDKEKDALWGMVISKETNSYYASFMSHLDPFSVGYAGPGQGGPKSISSYLYNKIDSRDVRLNWYVGADPTVVKGQRLLPYTGYKYVDVGQFASDYIYLRVAEMHFVKAEALFLSGDQGGAKVALETVMKKRVEGYTTTKTGDDLLEEIRIQKRIETWGEGCRLFDMKWRGEALDRSRSTNHRVGVIAKLPANPEEYVYQIPRAEMDVNLSISEGEQNPNPPKRDKNDYIQAP